MSLLLVFQVTIYYYFFLNLVISDTLFSITHPSRYRKQTFICVPNEDCKFECNNIATTGSADSSGCIDDVTSTTTYSHGSCECSTIHCSDGGYKCYIGCNRQNSCYYNNIYCGNNSMCNIHCNDTYSCNYATIYCGNNSQCNLYCHGRFSCQGTNFHCGANSNCTVDCNGDASSSNKGYECQLLNIYAQQSNSLSIDVYNNYWSAGSMTVYAPNTDNSSSTKITCGIKTFTSSNSQLSCSEMTIYSVEGWNDVQLELKMPAADVFGDYGSAKHRMFCGENNEFFCLGWAINGNLMQCDSDITICNTYTLH